MTLCHIFINQCSKSCGGGTQTRPVTCRDHLGQTLPDHRCHPSGRPEYSQSCHTDPCPTAPPVPEKTYRWKTASWTTVGELSSTTTETTFFDDNTTPSLTMGTFFTSTPDSINNQTIANSTVLDLFTFSSETYPVTILSNNTSTTPSAYPSPLYATSLTRQISTEPTNTTAVTTFDPEATIAATIDMTSTTVPTTTVTATSPAISTTTTEMKSSLDQLSSSQSNLEPQRPVTFDWNSYASPPSSFMTASTRYLSTSSSRFSPVSSLPLRPTYAYFANYYRFDSPTVRHSRRPDWFEKQTCPPIWFHCPTLTLIVIIGWLLFFFQILVLSIWISINTFYVYCASLFSVSVGMGFSL